MRAPERASEAAQEAFLRAVLHRRVTDRGDIVARARPSSASTLEGGAAVIVVRAHHFAPAEDDWRVRVLAAAERAARAAAPGSIAAIDDPLGDTAGPDPRPLPGGRRRRVAPHRRGGRARAAGARCTASRSPSATRASRSTRSTSTAPATRRCSPPTWPRRSRAARTRSRAPGGAGVRGDRRLPAAAAGDERGPGRAAALLRRDGRAAGRPTTSSTRPTSCRRSRRSWTATATSPTPRSGCSPTATRSATGSSACATSAGSTSAPPTGARSSGSG